MRVRGGVIHRLLHVGEEPVVVRVAQLAPRSRAVRRQGGATRAAAEWGIERMRAALWGSTSDLREFYERFRFDPLIGRAVRADPALRVTGRPEPFEALTWAICEQLIEVRARGGDPAAADLAARAAVPGMRVCAIRPDAEVLAGQAPA